MNPVPCDAQVRSNFALFAIVGFGAVLFIVFVALGTWQLQRLSWKKELLARVDKRVHANPVAPPARSRWAEVTAESEEYRHVTVSGIFLDSATSKVLASTVLGRGYWVMTPLRIADGSIILINRGFVAGNAKTIALSAISASPVQVTGLLRMSEPNGAFLHHNDPAHQLWYSRDVAAIGSAHQLSVVAPYFIDADLSALNPSDTYQKNGAVPVGGLTIISFYNNHLVYTLTWFALALMVAGACYYLIRSELKVRRS